MPKCPKDLSIRLALDLAGRELMPETPHGPAVLDRVRYHVAEMQSVLRRLQLADHREFKSAQAKLARDVLPATTCHLRGSLDQLYQHLARPNDGQSITAGGMMSELRAMENEFGESMSIASDLSTLSMVTDPIVLEDVPLGAFRVELDLARLRRGSADPSQRIRVEARDPNSASSDESVTHPHVRDDTPCLGDALVPIKLALRQGRFMDVFQMVISVLSTYNDGSPYVPLDSWHGVDCDACGRSVNPDDAGTCDECGDCLCSSCSYTCDACGVALCSGCTKEAANDDTLCRSCAGTCANCDETIRKSDLDDAGLCSDCVEQQENDDESDEHPLTTYPDPGAVPSPIADVAA